MAPGPLDIQLLTETASYSIFARDNLVALVERTSAGHGSIGSTGMLTDEGLGYLTWREGRAFLTGKGFERPARADEVEAVRRFSEDLKARL